MSANLYYRATLKSRFLGYDLKWQLAHELWGSDGSLNEPWAVVDSSMLPFLKGIRATSTGNKHREADKLIKLIEKYGEIEVSLQG